MNELFGPFASFCKVDETSVGAGWKACRRGHGKQAQTEDAPFKRAKKTIAESSFIREDSAIIFFARLKGASSV